MSTSHIRRLDHPTPSRISLLWSFARPHRRILIVCTLLGFSVSALELTSPMVTRWVLNSLGTGGTLLLPILLLVVLLIMSTAMSWWQWTKLGTLAEDVAYEARTGMIRRYLQARVFPLLRRPNGELVTRVTSDSVLLREAAGSSLVGLLNGIVMLIGTITFMAILDLPLVLTTLAAVVVVGVVYAALMPPIGRAQQRSQAALGDLGAALEQSLQAIKTIKVAGAQERQAALLRQHATRSRSHSVRAVRRESLVWSIATAGIQATIVVILGVGAWRVTSGDMSVPTLVAFLLYAFGLVGPVTELGYYVTSLQTGLVAAARIREVDEIDQEPASAGLGISFDPKEPAIAFRGVTAGYSDSGRPTINDLDLIVPARGHTAIVGPSGAGKTTVMSLILRFLDPSQGDLRLGGIPYSELDFVQVRSHFAYVEQETPTLPGTLRENLVFTNPDVTDQQITEVLRQLKLDTMVEAMPYGLDTPLSGSTVSGGQRQRIAIARALLSQPDVLLLDEATAQLDALSEAAIHQVIRDHASSRAVVTIAHRLSTIIDADTIVVMDAGRVVAQGRHDELLVTSKLYRDLVDALRLDDRRREPVDLVAISR